MNMLINKYIILCYAKYSNTYDKWVIVLQQSIYKDKVTLGMDVFFSCIYVSSYNLYLRNKVHVPKSSLYLFLTLY